MNYAKHLSRLISVCHESFTFTNNRLNTVWTTETFNDWLTGRYVNTTFSTRYVVDFLQKTSIDL